MIESLGLLGRTTDRLPMVRCQVNVTPWLSMVRVQLAQNVHSLHPTTRCLAFTVKTEDVVKSLGGENQPNQVRVPPDLPPEIPKDKGRAETTAIAVVVLEEGQESAETPKAVPIGHELLLLGEEYPLEVHVLDVPLEVRGTIPSRQEVHRDLHRDHHRSEVALLNLDLLIGRLSLRWMESKVLLQMEPGMLLYAPTG